MQVHVVSFSGEDDEANGTVAVCTTLELAIARAEGQAQEQFDADPELSIAGSYMNTFETDYGTCVGVFNPNDFCVDCWTITEETVESQE